jgi:ribosomal protein L28
MHTSLLCYKQYACTVSGKLMHQADNFVQALIVVLSLYYTIPYVLRHYTYTPYGLCTNLCNICGNCMSNVDCETRRNLLIESWIGTDGKCVDMKMSTVALRAGERARQKTGNQQN